MSIKSGKLKQLIQCLSVACAMLLAGTSQAINFAEDIAPIIDESFVLPSDAEMQLDIQAELNDLGTVYKVIPPNSEMSTKAVISLHANLLETNADKTQHVMSLNSQEASSLRSLGFIVKKYPQWNDAYQAKRILQMKSQALSANNVTAQKIPGFACYDTVAETFGIAQGLVASNPTLAEWIDIGDSWEKTVNLGGEDLSVLKITNQAVTGDKPKLFINTGLHAREYAPVQLGIDFARLLLNEYETNADANWIVNNHEVHILMQTNPDGRKKAQTGISWRKNTNQNYCGSTSNSRGADLNRNFAYNWDIVSNGASTNQCSNTYKGPVPGSEPETQAMQAYMLSIFGDNRADDLSSAAPLDTQGMHLDIHSFSELVLWPWGYANTPAPNGTQLQTLGRKLAYWNGYEPKQAAGLYPTTGTTDDYAYGQLGIASFTYELGTAFFQDCGTYENTIKPTNLPSLVYAAKVVSEPYRLAAGPEVYDLKLNNAANAIVAVGSTVNLTAIASDNRYENQAGTEASQNVIAAEYYIDTPPWATGATAIAMSAADTSFNSKNESVTSIVSTAGLSLGKHTVFVRAKDANDQWGAVSAGFITVSNSANAIPTASFTATCNELACSFDASASSDSDGSIANYSWNFADGSISTGVTTAHNYSVGGTFNVALTVTDNEGGAATAINPVTVIAPIPDNSLENGVARTGLSDARLGTANKFTLDAPANATNLSFTISGGSGDADLYVRFGAEPTTSSYDCRPYRNGNSETCSFATPQTGTYYVMLRGYAAYSGVRLIANYDVATPNDAPTAAFTASCTDLSCTVDASASSDPDGSIANYAWDFGDGSTGSGSNASVTYVAGGDYTITLTVTDNRGASDSVTQSVSVVEPPNVAPTASFTSTCSDLGCSFNASASSDSDGTISNYAWDFGDGQTSNVSTSSTVHTYTTAGSYTVTLSVTDNDAAESTLESGSVTVTDPPPLPDGSLQNGVPETGLSDSLRGTSNKFTIAIPAGASNLRFNISGGSGDADLYTRFANPPTTSTYDCRPYRNGNSETCTEANPQVGTYHVMLRAYRAFSGVSLVATYTDVQNQQQRINLDLR